MIIICPLTLLLLVIWFLTKKRIFGKITGGIWMFLFSLISLMCVASLFTQKMSLDKNEIYGEYVINKNKCPGKQANWQYEQYRFEIKKDNKLYFKILKNKKVIKTIVKNIEIKEYYHPSPRLDIKTNIDDFHIIRENPTLYREIWTYYYVFHSEKFGNIFFTKKKWYQF